MHWWQPFGVAETFGLNVYITVNMRLFHDGAPGGIMSSNPNPNFELRPQSKFPWPLVAVVAAAVILAVFLFYLPRTPKRGPNATAAQVPPQPFGQTLQITNLKVQPSPAGGSAYIQGTVSNTSSKKINDVTVVTRFFDKAGNVVLQDTVPMQSLPKETANTVGVSFAEDPLKPDSSKEFRIAIDNVPDTWNHEAPSIEIAHVGFAGQPPASAQGDTNGVQTGPASGQLPASDVSAIPKPSPSHEAAPRKNRRGAKRAPAAQSAVPTNPPL